MEKEQLLTEEFKAKFKQLKHEFAMLGVSRDNVDLVVMEYIKSGYLDEIRTWLNNYNP